MNYEDRKNYCKDIAKYCEIIVEIGELQTAIIQFDKMDAFLEDNKFLENYLSMSTKTMKITKDTITRMVKECYQYSFLRLGIAIREFRKNHNYCFPVHCMNVNNEYYHVHLNLGWLCRECKYENGPVLMSLTETGDGIFYPDITTVKLPNFFKKTPCKRCGKMLQNHIILID